MSTSYLTNCEKLSAVPTTETTSFNRFVLFESKKTKGPLKGQATLATDFIYQDEARWKVVQNEVDAVLHNLKRKFPFVPVSDVTSGPGKIRRVTVAGLGPVTFEKAPKLELPHYLEAFHRLSPKSVFYLTPTVGTEGQAMSPRLNLNLSSLLDPVLESIRKFAVISYHAKSKATWAVGLSFEQEWKSKGYTRGALVRSLPLTPGEQLEVVIKTWDRRTERKQEVEAINRNRTTEVIGEEKWMLASKMTFADQLNAGLNPNGGVNAGLTIPSDTVNATLGGTLGLSGNFSNQLTQAAENGTEFIQSSMTKAARSLQASRTNTVELSSDSGEEVTQRQLISNTNRCQTLTYHYFDVKEHFSVETKMVDSHLYLMIPLDFPEITKEWILCHECYLRTVLPCSQFYLGLEAAKKLKEWEEFLRFTQVAGPSFLPPSGSVEGGNGETVAEVSTFDFAVQQVLETWSILKNAEMFQFGASPDEGSSFLDRVGGGAQAIADGLQGLHDGIQQGVETALDQAGSALDSGLQAIGDAVQTLSQGVGSFLPFSGTARMAGTARPQGGAGTWLYYKVAESAAPQLKDSMEFLDTAWPETQALSGQERQFAEYTVLQTFFTKLGMPSATFGKLDALFAGAAAAAVGGGAVAGGVTGGVIGAGVGAAIAVWGAGVSAIPGAIIGGGVGGAGGAAAGGGAVAGVLALIASLEAMGIADTVPDDVGLGDATQELKGLFDSVTALAPVRGIPGMSDAGTDAEAQLERASAQERWFEQLRDRASAQVELDRLMCHLHENLSHYMQGLWIKMSDRDIQHELRKHGIPSHVVASRFDGFHGNMGALPVIDVKWVETNGDLDWKSISERVKDRTRNRSKVEEIQLSTPGMVVEPSLGDCNACEPFIQEHRALDLRNREIEVEHHDALKTQAKLEADRFQLRLDQELLDDPTPYDSLESLHLGTNDQEGEA